MKKTIIIKATVVIMFFALNLALFLRAKKEQVKLPTAWTPLAELKVENREELLSSAFALTQFDIQPLSSNSDSVKIPFPVHWREQALLNFTSTASQYLPSDKNPAESKFKQKMHQTDITSVAVLSYNLGDLQDDDGSMRLINEKFVSRDAYMTSNNIAIPLLEYVGVGRYYVGVKNNQLVRTQMAIQINGQTSMIYAAAAPHWLHPNRSLKIGETWLQLGVHPLGTPNTAPVPEITRKLVRLVLFEGHHAAEIYSEATCYDYAPNADGTHTRRKERSTVYVDLGSGEPLWFEIHSQSEGQASSYVRGCNQIFTKHLLRVPKR